MTCFAGLYCYHNEATKDMNLVYRLRSRSDSLTDPHCYNKGLQALEKYLRVATKANYIHYIELYKPFVDEEMKAIDQETEIYQMFAAEHFQELQELWATQTLTNLELLAMEAQDTQRDYAKRALGAQQLMAKEARVAQRILNSTIHCMAQQVQEYQQIISEEAKTLEMINEIKSERQNILMSQIRSTGALTGETMTSIINFDLLASLHQRVDGTAPSAQTPDAHRARSKMNNSKESHKNSEPLAQYMNQVLDPKSNKAAGPLYYQKFSKRQLLEEAHRLQVPSLIFGLYIK